MNAITIGRTTGWLASVVLAGLLLSCGPVKGYPGATRADDDIATIRPNPYWSGIGVVVTAVDGLEVNGELALAVLPGTRDLELRLVPYSLQEMNDNAGPVAGSQAMYNAEWRTPTEFTVDVVAGRTYAISGRWENEVYYIEFQDDQSRAVVASKTVPAIRNRD